MLIENQKVEIKITRANKEWYINKGYSNIQSGDKILVNVEDLTCGSKTKVQVRCDYCGKIVPVEWKDYVKRSNGKNACKNCRLKKVSENTLKQRQDSLYSRALEFCKTKGYTLLASKEDIQHSNSYVKYICPKHGESLTKIYALILGHGCLGCQYETNALKMRHPVDYVEKVFKDCGAILLNKVNNCITNFT